MRPPRPAPRPKRGRGRPPKAACVNERATVDLAWHFLLERGPDFRGTRHRADALLADFLAFALSTRGWHVSSVKSPRDFLALLHAARYRNRKGATKRAEYERARNSATAQRAAARAKRESMRKR